MSRYSFTSISIDGFRGLKKLHLEDLGLINLLVGENNCGKTSVLEAISILCDPYHPQEWLEMVGRRDFGRLDESRLQSLRWCFAQRGQLFDPDVLFEGRCTMECTGKFPLLNLTASYADLLFFPDLEKAHTTQTINLNGNGSASDVEPDSQVRGARLFHAFKLLHGSKADDGSITTKPGEPYYAHIELRGSSVTVRPFGPTRLRVKAQTITPYSYQVNSTQIQSRSRQSVFHDDPDLTIDLIREFDPDVEEILIASLWGERPAIYLKHKKLGPAPLSVFGDGLRRAVLLAGTIPTLKDGGVLLLDELETGIHIRAFERVFTWLVKAARKFNFQVIATTHSLEAVDAVLAAVNDKVDDISTYHLKQTDEQTIAKRIDGEFLHDLRYARGLDIR